jgi:hypothetical protein
LFNKELYLDGINETPLCKEGVGEITSNISVWQNMYNYPLIIPVRRIGKICLHLKRGDFVVPARSRW